MRKLPTLEEMVKISEKEIDKEQTLVEPLGGTTVTWFELFLRVNTESEERCYKLQSKIEELEQRVKQLEKDTGTYRMIG